VRHYSSRDFIESLSLTLSQRRKSLADIRVLCESMVPIPLPKKLFKSITFDCGRCSPTGISFCCNPALMSLSTSLTWNAFTTRAFNEEFPNGLLRKDGIAKEMDSQRSVEALYRLETNRISIPRKFIKLQNTAWKFL